MALTDLRRTSGYSRPRAACAHRGPINHRSVGRAHLGRELRSRTGRHFDLEEEVTHAIVAAIAPQIHAAEDARSRRLRPDNLNAHALAHNGWASDALAIDANCSLALRTMAMVACVSQHNEFITPDPGAWADRRHPRRCY